MRQMKTKKLVHFFTLTVSFSFWGLLVRYFCEKNFKSKHSFSFCELLFNVQYKIVDCIDVPQSLNDYCPFTYIWVGGSSLFLGEGFFHEAQASFNFFVADNFELESWNYR